ncbi:unnamed protein product, partial [Ixodes pacificus]
RILTLKNTRRRVYSFGCASPEESDDTMFVYVKPFCSLVSPKLACTIIGYVSAGLAFATSLAAFMRVIVASSDSRIIPENQGEIKGKTKKTIVNARLDLQDRYASSLHKLNPTSLWCSSARSWY